MTARRLDEVTIFDGKLSFLIPHEWVGDESEIENNYLYRLPDSRSGWFRASLLIKKCVGDANEQLRTFFPEPFVRDETTGNLVRRSDKASNEDGHDIHIFYWFVANCVPPDSICEAVFSYTVLAEELAGEHTQSEIRLLSNILRNARFASSA